MRICRALKKIQPSFIENLASAGHNDTPVIVQRESELKDLLGCGFFSPFFLMTTIAGCVNQPIYT